MERSLAKAVLRNMHALTERQYKGDIDAIVALVDFETALERANLTARQAQAIALVYGDDLTQSEAGKRLGIDRRTVNDAVTYGTARIDEIYAEWAKMEADE